MVFKRYNFPSDTRCMQIATRLYADGKNIKEYKDAKELILKNQDLTKDEKEYILSLLNKINPNNTFSNTMIGFNN